MIKTVVIFTDGSCLGNPGPGGYGIILEYKDEKKILSNGYYYTTNNRMELMAAIIALESLTGKYNVTINTDSKYLRNGITNWIYNWKERGWKTTSRNLVKNVDLWLRLEKNISYHNINWNWIKGHYGYPENEMCDQLAKNAAHYPFLYDFGYKKNNFYSF